MSTPKTNALVAATLSPTDLTSLLQDSGMLSRGSEFHRMSLEGGKLVAGDDIYVFNERKPETPAATVRIVKPPFYYNALWVDDAMAHEVNRPDLSSRFVKKFDNPNDDSFNSHDPETYDVLTKTLGVRGAFKGDILLQIVPPSGEMTGEEPIYTLTLPTTSVFEWRGSTRNPNGGSVSEFNFIYKLADFAMKQAADTGEDETGQRSAVSAALTALRLGGVVADIRLWTMKNDDGSRSWTVISFDPVHVEPADDSTPALTDGTDEDIPL